MKITRFAALISVFFLLSMLVGCAGLKPQMNEIQGSESKIFSYSHAELNLEFKVPVKVTEIRQDSYRFTGPGMPDIFVHFWVQHLPSAGYTYHGLDGYAKSMNAILFETVKPDGFEWREGIYFFANKPTSPGVGYVTRKHEKLIQVGFNKNFLSNDISEIRGTNYKNKALFSAFSELDSWVKIVSKDKGQVKKISQDKENTKTSWKEISEKIEKLGELHNKGLITKEEYESKKNELLKNF